MKKICVLCVLMCISVLFTACQLDETVSNLGGSILSQANGSGASDPNGGAFDSTTKAPDASSADESRLTAEDMRPVVEELVNTGFTVCSIFYNGLPFDEETRMNDANGNATTFAPVVSEEYRSINDLKAAAEAVYTPDYAAAALYSSAFSGDYPLYAMFGEQLCVNTDVGGFGWGIAWQFDTLQIVSQTENSCTVSMETTLFDEDDGVKQLVLSKIDGAWRLDSSILGL